MATSRRGFLAGALGLGAASAIGASGMGPFSNCPVYRPMPPIFSTSSNPMAFRIPLAFLLRAPLTQYRYSGVCSVCFSGSQPFSVVRIVPRKLTGRLSAPGMWPYSYSRGSRTSMMSAPCMLRASASFALISTGFAKSQNPIAFLHLVPVCARLATVRCGTFSHHSTPRHTCHRVISGTYSSSQKFFTLYKMTVVPIPFASR